MPDATEPEPAPERPGNQPDDLRTSPNASPDDPADGSRPTHEQSAPPQEAPSRFPQPGAREGGLWVGLLDRETRRALFLTSVAALIASSGSVYNAWREASLERQRFRAELIRQALEAADSTERAQRLRFNVELGLLQDTDGRIRRALEKSSALPSYAPPQAVSDPGGAAFNIWPVGFGESSTHELVMVDAFVSGAHGTNGRFSESARERASGLAVREGDQVVVSIYFRNHGTSAEYGTAQNVRVVSEVLNRATEHKITAAIVGDNTTTAYSDDNRGGVYPIRSQLGLRLVHVPRTTRLCIRFRGSHPWARPDRTRMTMHCGGDKSVQESLFLLPDRILPPEPKEPGSWGLLMMLGSIPPGADGLITYEVRAESAEPGSESS